MFTIELLSHTTCKIPKRLLIDQPSLSYQTQFKPNTYISNLSVIYCRCGLFMLPNELSFQLSLHSQISLKSLKSLILVRPREKYPTIPLNIATQVSYFFILSNTYFFFYFSSCIKIVYLKELM